MASPTTAEPRLAVLIPCLDEEDGVALVVKEYEAAFPAARILVVDNGSTDRTAERARAAGAEVVAEPRRGKARAIVTAFGLLEDDLVVMVDGDGSYPAEGARRLLAAWRDDPADMITGHPRRRKATTGLPAAPPGRERGFRQPCSAWSSTTSPATCSPASASSASGSTRTSRCSSGGSSSRPS